MHQPIEKSDTQENTVLVLKLANGETIIATVDKETATYIEVRMPFRLFTIMNQNGNMSLTIMKWDITLDLNYPVRLFKTTIVACGKPNAEMLKGYDDVLINGFDNNENDDDQLEDVESVMKELKASNTKIH